MAAATPYVVPVHTSLDCMHVRSICFAAMMIVAREHECEYISGALSPHTAPPAIT